MVSGDTKTLCRVTGISKSPFWKDDYHVYLGLSNLAVWVENLLAGFENVSKWGLGLGSREEITFMCNPHKC